MICSDCGGPLVPVVAIDIDGTIAKYHEHFLDLCSRYTGLPLPKEHYYGGPEGSWRAYIRKHYGIDNRTYEDIKLAYRQGSWKRWQTPLPGVQDLWDLINDAEVWVTTTRPYLRHDSIDPDTRFWLERQGLDYYGLLYDDEKYEALRERVDPERVVAVLEDLPEQYDSAAKEFGAHVPILHRTTWNYGASYPTMVRTLREAGELIERRIANWYEARSPVEQRAS